jgi:UDP-glucuronate decarboxylase
MKKIVVTVEAGFVGSNLCKRLLNECNELICWYNYFTGNKKNKVKLLNNPYFKVVRHDIIELYYTK